jgi:putative ABC transport system permease protein
MRTALARKSTSDLTRRPVRSFLTVLTIAIAVAGMGIFAIPGILDRAMADRVARHRIFDAWVLTVDVPMDAPTLARLRAVDNVRDLEARAVFRTRILVGERRGDALVVGVPDFRHQTVDAVEVVAGRAPAADEVLIDPAAVRSGRWAAGSASSARLLDATGTERAFRVSGRGQSLEYTAEGEARRAVVVYAPERMVERLAGFRGPNTLAVHVRDRSKAAVDETMQDLRRELDELVGRNSFLGLPLVRPAGSWPGEEGVATYDTFLIVIAFVALGSSVFLIGNTMNTLVSEQRREIGVMKAIGARRRVIYRTYLRTAASFGLAGGLLGAVLAVATANVMARFIGGLMGVRPPLDVPWPSMAAAVVVGLTVALLASLPSLRRANRVTVREALADDATSVSGGSRTEAWLRRLRLGPMASIGVRSVTRRPGRTASTMLQVSLAVAIMISFLTLSRQALDLTNGVWERFREDLQVRADTSSTPLDASTVDSIASTPGVAKVEPSFITNVAIGDERLEAWGLAPDATSYRPNVTAGRWLRPTDDGRVAVLGAGVARSLGLQVGSSVELATPAGTVHFSVIGIDDSLVNNGRSFFTSLPTMRALIGDPEATNSYWVIADDRAAAAVDRLASRLEDQLTSSGHAVTIRLTHVERSENVAANRTITESITVFGLLIVAISMIGLVNAVTMNVIDRTREIGVLRCLGACSRDIGRVFRSEGLAVAGLGWLVGIPLGYAASRALTQLVFSVFDFRYAFVFAWSTVWIAFVGALLLALVAMVPPIRRATHIRAGDALRYQ